MGITKTNNKYENEVIDKCVKVIESCSTHNHIIGAAKYISQYFKLYQNENVFNELSSLLLIKNLN